MNMVTIDNSKIWTVADYLLLGESNAPCQLIDGDLLMSPSPTPYHQTISSNINDFLKTEARKTGGTVFYAPMDLYVDQKNVFQPDLMYISVERKHIITQRGVEGVPDLVVEIISPNNIFADRNKKKSVYQQLHITEYWIVDPANKTLEIYHNSQENWDIPYLFVVESGSVTSTVLSNLAFDLKEIF